MKFIGITGGVGAGKSKILAYLQEQYGAKVVLADQVAADLMEPTGACFHAVAQLLKEDKVLLEDGTFHRGKIAKVIFSEEEKRKAMNRIIHPAVKEQVLAMVEEERAKGEVKYFFLESALLLEDHYDELVDELWYIYASEEVRFQRLQINRGYDEEKIKALFQSQKTEAQFREKADIIINNDKTLEESFSQIDDYFAKRR